MDEPAKYNIKEMLCRNYIFNEIDMIMKVNSNTDVKNMRTATTPNYTLEDIQRFISKYNTDGLEGMGILFIAESLNKKEEEAYYHFVAMNIETKEIIWHKRLRGRPGGNGLRNYWAGSFYDVIKKINNRLYQKWKNEYDKSIRKNSK